MNEGQTIIIVTHEPDIARHCDRVIQLEDGRVKSDANASSASGS